MRARNGTALAMMGTLNKDNIGSNIIPYDKDPNLYNRNKIKKPRKPGLRPADIQPYQFAPPWIKESE